MTARWVEVPQDESGRRLDNFLLARLKGVPRSRVYRMIRSGEVRINGGRGRAETRLAGGDQVRIPPLRRAAARGPGGPPPARVAWLERRLLHVDRDLLVVDKPAGLAVHGGSGVSWGVIELLRAGRYGGEGLELAHRLDRETSGCLVLARRRPVLRALHQQFRDGELRKEYLALLCGRWRGGERPVDQPLRTVRIAGERRSVPDPGGRIARSRFVPLQVWRRASWCRVQIDTGRMHQIRAHAVWLGHPVVGDPRYGGEAAMETAAALGLKRMGLHAAAISFEHPRSGLVLRCEAPLDDALQATLAALAAAGQ
ncbi:MAG: RluA family pseudouridine synthase [Gammaproteobacteria bacterium]|nr:MAG: RluA family pseudouridine synthase [Gammaproteobacteria bacterium]